MMKTNRGEEEKPAFFFFFFAQTGIQPKRHTRQIFAHAQTLMCKVYAFCLWDVRTYSSHQNFNQPHKAVTLGICQKRTLASLCNIAVKITVWTPWAITKEKVISRNFRWNCCPSANLGYRWPRAFSLSHTFLSPWLSCDLSLLWCDELRLIGQCARLDWAGTERKMWSNKGFVDCSGGK